VIVCPECGAGQPVDRDIQESVFEWRCTSCGEGFEVRVVFLSRAKPIHAAEFRAEVSRLLADQGLTKTELAKLVGVTPAYISTVLSGRRIPGSSVARRMLHVLASARSTRPPTDF
jgi:transposase-like protein